MVAKLIIEEGDLKGLSLSLEKKDIDEKSSEWILGRDLELTQLSIQDPKVSRKHLLIKEDDKQGFLVQNLSTTNPTLLNGKLLDEPTILKSGDSLKVGNQTLRFLEEELAQIVANGESDEEEEGKTPSLFEEQIDDEHAFLADIDLGPEEVGRFVLKVISGPNNGAEFHLETETSYTLGTDPEQCDIVFNDTSISRKHALLNLTKDDQILLTDLGSRNGTHVDGETITDAVPLFGNSFVTLGTTSFVVMDRGGEMQTIISPLLPSIVETLKKETPEKKTSELEPAKEVPHHTNTFVWLALLGGLLLIAAIGATTLFQSREIVEEQVINEEEQLSQVLKAFPTVTYSYNEATGRLLLVGHVLEASDKNQLLHNLQGLKFIRDIDSGGIIIDEFVWRETNQILGRNPEWKGINVHSPRPGTYVMSGYLKSRKQAENLSDYVTANFPYLDRLERKVIVEEDVVNRVEAALTNSGLRNVDVLMNNGELTLRGGIGKNDVEKYNALLNSFYKIPGVRSVKNFVSELSQPETIVDLSDRYKVAGFTRYGGGQFSVVINGSILKEGDSLDGMKIVKIQRSEILLEKGESKFRIRF